MTQEQFNFLECFSAYLTRKGFRINKSLYDAEAIAEAELFDTPVSVRFDWKWQGQNSSIRLRIWIGLVMLQRRFLTALLMDYAGSDADIFTSMLRGVMQDAADIIAKQFK